MTSIAYPIDVGILIIFLIINLLIGLGYGRRVKNLKDYALGGKNFSTGTLAATIVATWSSGGVLFVGLEKTYSDGLYFILTGLGTPIGILLSGQLAIRMGEFLNNVSVAEAMGDMYGKAVQVITAISGIMAKIGYTAFQFKTISMMLSSILNLDSLSTTLAAASIVIVYSTLGGIRSVTFTDVLQFFTFGTIIPILALVIWNNVQDSNQVVATIKNNPNFDIKKVVGWSPQFKDMLNWFFYLVIPGLYAPEIFQRIAMARDIRQVKHSLTYAAGIFLLKSLLITWLGILLLSDKPGLAPGQVVSYVIQHHAYTGLRGLLGVGIMALAMSTADSCLNASSVLFANDIVKPLTGNTAGSIKVARLFSFFIGFAALVLALHSSDLLSLVLRSGSFYMPIFTVPMLLAVLGFRSTKRAVLLGMAAGFMTVILWSIFKENTTSIAPGMLANLIGLIGTHYLLGEKGGWQQTDPSSPLGLARVARKQAWIRRIKAAKNFKLYPYLQQNLPKQEYFYFLFGLYTIAATYAAFYTVGENATAIYEPIYKGIYHTTLVATTFFLTFPVWPPVVKSERFMTFLWPLGICAILFFAGTLLAIMSHFHIMQVMVLMSNLLVAVLLLRWPLALMLAAGGMVLAALFFKQYTGLATLPGDLGSLQFRIIYGSLLFSSFLIALFKHKQAYKHLEDKNEQLTSEREATSTELVEALYHRERFVQEMSVEGIEVFNTVHKLNEKLAQEARQVEAGQSLTTASETLKVASQKLKSAAAYLDQVTYQVKDYMRLDVSMACLQEELHNIFEDLDRHDLQLRHRVIIKKYTQHKELQCDIVKVRQLLVRSICYAQRYNKDDKPILLGIEDAILGYPIISIKGHVKKVQALCITITTANTLPTHKALYLGSVDQTAMRPPQSAKELPLTQNQHIVDAHYGTTEFIEEDQSITQVYVIPVRIREVRPKTMDLSQTAERVVDTTVYDEETAFVKAVENKTEAEIALVQQAIQLIKKYHGPVKRKSGEPFYLHPIAVAHILLDYTKDQDTIIAALLHDTVEDTRLSLTQVELLFNTAVQHIVDGVTHLDSNLKTLKRVQLAAYENIQQLLKVDDERILYVKLADRLHNMRTIEGHPSLAKQQQIGAETLQFFVPVAKNLGLIPLAEELQQLAFAVMNKQ